MIKQLFGAQTGTSPPANRGRQQPRAPDALRNVVLCALPLLAGGSKYLKAWSPAPGTLKKYCASTSTPGEAAQSHRDTHGDVGMLRGTRFKTMMMVP